MAKRLIFMEGILIRYVGVTDASKAMIVYAGKRANAASG
jgi:hypothetical protein